MKTSYPKSFSSTKYPKFIRDSIFLKHFSKPEKVFPRIGLKNTEMKLSSLKLSKKGAYKVYLVRLISAFINVDVSNIDEDFDNWMDDFVYTLDNADLEEFSFVEKNGKLIIKMPDYMKQSYFPVMKSNPILIGKDQNFLDVIDQIKKKLPATKRKIFDHITIENSTPTIPKNLSICFSSEGSKGHWDLATMSMRGVSSCMRWKSDHATSLIGTIVDPYAGMIYITDNTNTKYGKKILARSVVRFVADCNNRPVILLERLYVKSLPGDLDGDDVMDFFKSFILANLTNKKIEIIHMSEDYYNADIEYRIPITEPTQSIIDLDNMMDASGSILSYRDSEVEYGKISKYFDPKKVSI